MSIVRPTFVFHIFDIAYNYSSRSQYLWHVLQRRLFNSKKVHLYNSEMCFCLVLSLFYRFVFTRTYTSSTGNTSSNKSPIDSLEEVFLNRYILFLKQLRQSGYGLTVVLQRILTTIPQFISHTICRWKFDEFINITVLTQIWSYIIFAVPRTTICSGLKDNKETTNLLLSCIKCFIIQNLVTIDKDSL